MNREGFGIALVGMLSLGHARSIVRTLLTSLDQLTGPALDVLRLASQLPAAVIPRDLLLGAVAALGDEDDDVRATPRAVDQSIGAAAVRSLARTAANGYEVHVLVSRVVRELHVAGRGNALARASHNVLASTLSAAADVRNHNSLATWLDLARALVATTPDDHHTDATKPSTRQLTLLDIVDTRLAWAARPLSATSADRFHPSTTKAHCRPAN